MPRMSISKYWIILILCSFSILGLQSTRRRQLLWKLCLTFCSQLMLATWPHLSCWTCPRHLILSTTVFCFDDLKRSVSMELFYAGSNRIWSADSSTFFFNSDCHCLRCTTGFCVGPHPVFTVHRRSAVADWTLWPASTSLCRRHSDLRFLLTTCVFVCGTAKSYLWVHWCCFELDEV